MHLATAHLLTALYSLSTGVGLTPEDRKVLEDRGTPLSPALWDETRATLELADRGGAGTELDLGFLPAIFGWLGVADEREFIERYGEGGVAEILSRDCGTLSEAAAALEGDRSRPLPLELSHAWSARAMRLWDALPATAPQVLLSLELALDGAPWEPGLARPLFKAIAHVAEMVDDRERLSGARTMLERLVREGKDDTAPDDSEPLPISVVAQVLTALWCLTHEGLVLPGEGELEPGIVPSPDTWTDIVGSLREGRFDIPAPVRLLRSWGAPEELDEEVVTDCLRRSAPLLPELLAEVERLWGGTEGPGISEAVARAVAAIALVRHQGLYETWVPLTGEPKAIYLEAYQGAQRGSTLDRTELMRRIRPVLMRAEADPLVVAAAHFDAAAEARAEGKHDQVRSHLEAAMHSTAGCEDPARRDYGAACVAQHIWFEGYPDAATLRLIDLEGEPANTLLRSIEAHAKERAALREAERLHAEREDVDSMCALVAAHIVAGHPIGAEAIAREGLAHFHDDPKAWQVVARLLFATDHFRSALVPALEALDKGIGRTSGVTLLARIAAHLGPEWHRESARLACEAVRAEDAREVLPTEVLSELADTIQYHGTDIATARLADDLVSDMAADDSPPVEWLGAAAARRCHGVFAEDAPAILARLADGPQLAPAALARFVVERVETLMWWRSKIERDLQAPDESPHESFGRWFADGRRELAHRHARSEAVGVALRAAISLGLAEPALDTGYEGSGADIAPAAHWEAHLKAIAACVGDDLAVCLRASELSQHSWFEVLHLGEHQTLVVLATFDSERIAWIRWLRDCKVVSDADLPGISPSTRERLLTLFEAAELVDDEDLRESGWVTPWHDASQC